MIRDADEDAITAIPLHPDDVFEAVSNNRRRLVIDSLDRSDGVVTAGDLAVEIAAIENNIKPSMVTGDQRTNVYIGLIQCHLDTLDELGVVEYDSRSKQVAKTEVTSALARHIRKLQTACYEPIDEEDADD